MSKKETLEVAAKIRFYFNTDTDAFAFLTLYLLISVRKRLKTKSMGEVQEEYKKLLAILETNYPANSTEGKVE